MSGIIRNYFAVTQTQDGLQQGSFGSMTEAMGEATLGGDANLVRRLSVASEDYVVVWQQEHAKLKFQQLGFRIIGPGTLRVFWRTDLPTSSTNYTPLGTRQRWHNKDWPCKMGPFWLCSQTALSHATLANEVADASGLPALMTTYIAQQDSVIVDKLVVYNPGDDPVIIEAFHAQ